MTEAWQCPDCAESVAASQTTCPYCGYATGAVAGPATRTARYGHCPSCGRSEWEAQPGRCRACGGELRNLQVVKVPLEKAAAQDGAAAAQSGAAAAQTGDPATNVRREPSSAVAPDQSSAAAPEPSSAVAADRPPAVAIARETTQPMSKQVQEIPEGIAILRHLAALRDDGIITAAEFEAKKTQILKRL